MIGVAIMTNQSQIHYTAKLWPACRTRLRLATLAFSACLSLTLCISLSSPLIAAEIHTEFPRNTLQAYQAAAAAQAAQEAKPLGKLQDLTSRASELVMQAMGMIGIHYKMGGNLPESGLDCSGLVRHVFKEAWGSTLPRTASEISRVGKQITQQELQPGDLVFYNTLRRGFSHVGIYLGDNKFIHSPSAGGQVRIESMELSYWRQRFDGARRIEEPSKVNGVK